MKIDLVKSIIALVISALISYGFYELCEDETQRIVLLCSTFILITSCFTIGCSLRTNGAIMLTTFSGIFFLIGIIIHAFQALFTFNRTAFLIIDGLLLLVYILTAQSIYKSKQ